MNTAQFDTNGVIAQIESGVLDKALSANSSSIPHLLPDSGVSLADIFRNVNSKDAMFAEKESRSAASFRGLATTSRFRKKEESGLSLRDDQERSHTEVNKTRIPNDNVSQSAENVKRENENLTTIRNLNVVEYRAGNEQARKEADADAEKLLEPKKRFSLSPAEKAQRA